MSQSSRQGERRLPEAGEPGTVPPAGRRSLGGRPAQINLSPEQVVELEAPPKVEAKSWLKYSVWAAVGAVLMAVVAVLGILEYHSRGLPSVAQLKSGYDPPQVTRILARDDTLLASVFTERRTVIPFEHIPDSAKLAFLAAEDAFFYEHEGLNYLGMLRALYANLRAGRTVQGGSTITQQVVKNLLLGATRSYERKIKETLLARRLEKYLTKDEIFWLYLSHIYLGHGRYGIEEAARFYFGKHARELRLEESALLAGLIAAPERFSPRRDPERSLERRHYVLQQMLDKGFVTQGLYAQVDGAPLRLAASVDSESEIAPEVLSESAAVLEKLRGSRKQTGGYTLHTTIDPELQALGRKAVRKGLDAYAARHGLLPPFKSKQVPAWGKPFEGTPKQHQVCVGVVESLDDQTATVLVRVGNALGRLGLAQETRYNPDQLPPSEFAVPGALLRVRVADQPMAEQPLALRLELGPQAALVAIDVRTRQIMAMIGGYEALPGGFNRVTQAKRQPGSTFKALSYSHALHSRKFTAASLLPASTLGTGASETVRLRQALAHSDNKASVALFNQSGPRAIVDWSHLLGIGSELQPDESLALGAYEVTPLELANAYATFASGGRFEPPSLVARVSAPDEREVALPPRPEGVSVMEPEEAYLMTSLLQSVVKEGTGQRAQQVGRPIAGKTGTTNEVKDAWFVGYTTDLVALVWVGFDDALPLGKGESGGRTALPIFVDFMKEAHRDRPLTDFVRPGSIALAAIDPKSGLLPYPGQTETVVEEFLPGTVPVDVAAAPPEASGAPDASAADPPANP